MPTSARIAIRGVSRRFGAALALAGLDPEVASDEFVALVGPSGCGKTTLLRVVADLEQASAGEVWVGREPPAVTRRTRMVGLVSQRPAGLPWKRAVDDVAFTQRVARRAGFPPRDLLVEFGLAGHEQKRPHQLSGRIVQRVNIASAFAHAPQVLLMDEPFSSLDEMTREELDEWLGRRPTTVLFVTHHIHEAVLLADRVVVFSPAPGRVLEDVRVPAARALPPRLSPGFRVRRDGRPNIRALLFGRAQPLPLRWPRACRLADLCAERRLP